MRKLLRRRPVPQQGYYPVAPSCQVTNLGFLLEEFLGQRADGVFVEVGAFDGYSWSNTWGLAEAGWSGWYIEPVPEYAEQSRQRHADHPRVSVDQLAIGDRNGSITITIGGSLSTVSEEALREFRSVDWAKPSFARHKVMEVEQTTLDDYLRTRSVEPRFDLLVVDVEGHEAAVFAGFSLEAWKPKMLIVELADTHPDLTAQRSEHARLSREIQRGGYEIVYKDATNTVFVNKASYDSATGTV